MALPTPTAGSFKAAWPTSVLLRLLVPAPLCLCQMCSPFPYPVVNEAGVGEPYGNWDQWSTGKPEWWDGEMLEHLGVLHQKLRGSMPGARLAPGESLGGSGIQIQSGSIEPGISQLSRYPMPELLVRKE